MPYLIMKNYIKIIGISLIPILVIVAMLLPTETSRAISRNEKLIEEAQLEFTTAQQKSETSLANYERLLKEADVEYQLSMDAEVERLCARCKAIQARKENCELGIACEKALFSQAELFEEWNEEYEYVCFEQIDINYSSCL